jgi:hypothetical protein
MDIIFPKLSSHQCHIARPWHQPKIEHRRKYQWWGKGVEVVVVD